MVRGNTALAYAPRRQARAAPAREEVVVPMSERVTIMDLKEAMCRWPLGDPASGEFRFCGAKKGVNQSGLLHLSRRIAYQPAQDRRRERRAQSA